MLKLLFRLFSEDEVAAVVAVDDSFTYSLILSFESAEDQAAYQTEPPHLVFIEECEDLWEKVIVYDSQGIQQ